MLFFAVGFFAATRAYAAVPTLSMEGASGDLVKVTVQGDPNFGVTLRYNIGGPAGELMTALGITNASGTFITTISSGAYAINKASQVYIVVNDLNSTTQAWPYTGSSVVATSTAAGAGQAAPPIAFGSSNPTISIGQTLKVALTGGTGKYVVSNSPNPNMVQATVGENNLVLTAIGSGSTFVTVCDEANNNRCSTIFFSIVNAVAAPAPTPAPVVAPAPTVPVSTPALTVASVVPTVPAASTNDVLTEIRTMQAKLLQILAEIQTMNTRLQELTSKLTVTAPASPAGAAAAPAAVVTGETKYKFTSELKIGSRGDDVTALQNRLTLEGFYFDDITGFYGSFSKQAVIKYQKAKGLSQTGIMDTKTRAALNGE